MGLWSWEYPKPFMNQLIKRIKIASKTDSLGRLLATLERLATG
jgi:hypothetical protein